MSRDNLAIIEADPERYLQQFVNMNKTWVSFQPDTKEPSKQWKRLESSAPKKVKQVHRQADRLHFLGCKGSAAGITLLERPTQANYAEMLRELQEKLKKIQHWKLTRGVLFHRDKAPQCQ